MGPSTNVAINATTNFGTVTPFYLNALFWAKANNVRKSYRLRNVKIRTDSLKSVELKSDNVQF